MITKFKPETEFATGERCHIVEMFNPPNDAACSIARARVEPGVTTQLHSLPGVTERYVILAGEGEVEIGDQSGGKVTPLDVVRIPAGISQRITNTGKSDLVFLCICSPRFTPDVYVNLEEK